MSNNYQLVESFDIDNGELDGINPQIAFVMGVEWSKFRQKLLTGAPFRDGIASANAERLAALCDRHGRFNETQPIPDFPEWSVIIVGGNKC